MGKETVTALLAAALQIAAYVAYSFMMLRGRNQPKSGSWISWVALSTANVITFSGVSGFIGAAQFVAGSIACWVFFLFALWHKKLEWPGKRDQVIILLSVISLGISYVSGPAIGNFVVIFAFGVSAIPTAEGILRNPAKENPLPWLLWTAASTFSVFYACMMSEQTIAKFAMPIANLLACGIMMLLSLRTTPPKLKKELLWLSR